MNGPSRGVIRGFAWLDLAVTAPLALPGVAAAWFSALEAIDGLLGGTAPFPALEPLHWLFVHLTGVLGVVWALARLSLPDPHLARIDAIGRAVVAGLVTYALVGGAPRVLALFIVTELAGTVAQLRPRQSAD